MMAETKMTVILDFYVHPNYENQGYGKAIINRILANEVLHKGQIGFYRLSKGFTKFLHKVLGAKGALKQLEGEHYMVANVDIPVKTTSKSYGLNKHASQTNLDALRSSQRNMDQRNREGLYENKLGSAQDLHLSNNYNGLNDYATRDNKEDKFERASGPILSPRNNGIFGKLGNQITSRDKRVMDFDEYLSEYEKAKAANKIKSPDEHRAKYYNDVFSSSLNFGTQKQGSPQVQRLVEEIESKSGKGGYNQNRNHSTLNLKHHTPTPTQRYERPMDRYVPDISQEFKAAAVDVVKPKGRFRNWEPTMRNLESTYDVKDVKLKYDGVNVSTENVVSQPKRINKGGKKLYVNSKDGSDMASNLITGFTHSSYR